MDDAIYLMRIVNAFAFIDLQTPISEVRIYLDFGSRLSRLFLGHVHT